MPASEVRGPPDFAVRALRPATCLNSLQTNGYVRRIYLKDAAQSAVPMHGKQGGDAEMHLQK